MTKEQWMELAKHIKTAFPKDRTFMASQEDAEIWYNLVMDWSFEDCKSAVWKHINNSNFPPSLHELKACYDMRRQEVEDFNKRIREIYREMANYYPECLRDKDSHEAYKNALKQVGRKQAIECAIRLRETVIGRVMSVERGNSDDLPPLSECIRSCFDELRRKP